MSQDVKVRNRIIESAREMFFQCGFTAITMEQIAESLGMSKKTLYQYFQSKDDLINEITGCTMEESCGAIRKIIADDETDYIQKLKNVMSFLTAIYSKMSPAMIQDMQRNVPEVWKKVQDFRHERLMTDFLSLIQEGVRKNVLRSDVDEKMIVYIWASAIETLLTPKALAQMPFSPGYVFDAITKVIFEGILTDESRINYVHNKTFETSTN